MMRIGRDRAGLQLALPWARFAMAVGGGLLLLGLGLVVPFVQCVQDRSWHRTSGRADPPGGARARARHGTRPATYKDGHSYYKGVQAGGPNNGVLTEGRYFYNLYVWSWEISPQFVVPGNRSASDRSFPARTRRPGILAEPGQKGTAQVLKPGRYPYNPYAELIELHDPVTIPAGNRGVVTRLAGRMPKDPNVFLVAEGERGVQATTLEPGTYYLNPYEVRVSQVDCRSRRFNLGLDGEMNFLSADGFPITLDGVVEFRILPDKVAEMFVKYNESSNGDAIDEEIIAKIITPESRSLCRVGGSKLSGGQFISGEEPREVPDRPGQEPDVELQEAGDRDPGRGDHLDPAAGGYHRAGAASARVKQKLAQFRREKLQQLSEAKLKIEVMLADQKKPRRRGRPGSREDHQGRAGAGGGLDPGRAVEVYERRRPRGRPR